MTKRDEEYVENRLLAPASELQEAIGRLNQCGYNNHADRLIEALAKLTDECRAVRREVIYGYITNE